jgi:hypothetical protein
MALSEVARNCAMHPAKVHLYLVSLVRAGLASQDAHRPVRPGVGRPSPRHGGAAPDGRRKYRRCLYLTAEGSEQPCHQRGGVDRGRTGHRPLGLGNPGAADQRAGRLGAAAARLDRRLDVPGAPARRADRRRAGHPAGPAGDERSRRRHAREAPGQNEARRDRELAAPDDLRHGGVRRSRIRPRPGPRASDRPRHARPPDGRGHEGGADRLADALRSTAGQISAELGYTARRSAPAPTRPQRWRR